MTSRRLLTAESRGLLAAADYIEKWGWHQGSASGSTGGVCAMGAILEVTDIKFHVRAMRLLCRHLGSQHIDYIPDWNDSPSRTKEEVISALREAAISEDAT